MSLSPKRRKFNLVRPFLPLAAACRLVERLLAPWAVFASVLVMVGSFAAGAAAQEPAPDNGPPVAEGVETIAARQNQVADKYVELEKLMLRMAELEAAANPQRAALLKRAAQQSSDRATRRELAKVVELLQQRKLGEAVETQQHVREDLQQLLKLLLSEDRADRIKDERQRVMEYIKEVERLMRIQRGLRGRNEGGAAADNLAEQQGELANRTGELAETIRRNEEGGANAPEAEDSPGDNPPQPNSEQKQNEEAPAEPGEKPESGADEGDPQDGSEPSSEEPEKSSGEPQDGSGKPKDKPSGEPGEPGESPSDPGQPSDSAPMPNGSPSQPSQGQPSQGQPSQGQPSQGQPSQGQPSQGQPPSEQSNPNEQGADRSQPAPTQENPVKNRLEAARERMEEAQKRLEEAQRDRSIEAMVEAEAELAKAKAELEEILRQLREEEVERMLALLEGRFRKMLEMQLAVREATIKLDQIPEDQRGREVEIEAGKLSFEERKILIEADRALTLLRDEGSSIAFPEVVTQMRDDMEQVVNLLAAARIGKMTQGLEDEIILALEEMVAALQKAQQDQEQQQQRPRPLPGGEPGEMPLVDQIAELKMIRALQVRVNQRTQRYSELLEDQNDPVGQVTESELLVALQRLADRESRIYRITRDLVLGKNK